MRLSLIVLRSLDPERLANFYGKLGIRMLQERHGTGPAHFAGDMGSGVIEIYPAKSPSKTIFGLAIASPKEFELAWIAAGGSVSPNGLMLDPDGNGIHLAEET